MPTAKHKIVMSLLLLLTISGILPAGVPAPVTSPQPPDNDANRTAKVSKMFPDGIEHDFGLVLRGTRCKHSFRIVNTSELPLKIQSLRAS
jgi:hypothetical protein